MQNEFDNVKNPKHYHFFDVESIEIIKKGMSVEEFRGFCKGSALKYRLRAGKKDDTTQDINKALEFEQIWLDYWNSIKTQGVSSGA